MSATDATVYDGDPFAYDFVTALGEANRLRHRVTAEALRKHASRFGPEGVAEVAASLGDDALVAEFGTTGTRRRRTTVRLRDQVVALRERGVAPAAIADSLNVSDRRVAQVLKEVA